MKQPGNAKATIELIIEKNDEMLWGIVEGKGNFTPTPYGETKDEVITNLKELIRDYQLNEGKLDDYWNKVDVNHLNLEISFNLQAFFKEFDELKISSIAKRAEINESLLRQYATGHKYPSAEQVKKIETAIHNLGERLKQANIYTEV
jgi:hypothetical protein